MHTCDDIVEAMFGAGDVRDDEDGDDVRLVLLIVSFFQNLSEFILVGW